jgi:hypothetical protein
MAAIRILFSWLTEKGVLALNPAQDHPFFSFKRASSDAPKDPKNN